MSEESHRAVPSTPGPQSQGRADMTLHCVRCRWSAPLSSLAWRCGQCGGVLDLANFSPALPARDVLATRAPTLWRYAEALPVVEPREITMGEGMTPLLAVPDRPGVGLKVDYLMPTGSFKDRGAVVLAALATELGVSELVADSSGNAGAAIAAYAARAGLRCEIFVPVATSEGKLAQLRAYGANVHRIPGPRENAAKAAMEASGRDGVLYASHVYHPVFLHGTKTYVFELWEQLGGRLPDTLVLPVGNGTLVLGAYVGCRELLEQRLIEKLPTIIAVQAQGCAPLAEAFARGLDEPVKVAAAETAAEGIAIARPARGAQILAAVRQTGGEIVSISEPEIRAAQADLAKAGLYVEPTAAVCWAAVRSGITPNDSESRLQVACRSDLERGIHTVVPLCGSGLKSRK